MTPKAFIHEREFAEKVARAERDLAHLVARIRFSLDEDWSGEPAVHFRVVLLDDAADADKLLKSTLVVRNRLAQEFWPFEEWGVYPYFAFRTVSEKESSQEPAWV